MDKEPAYPQEALLPGEVGEQAEDAWTNAMIIWGRTHHDRLARVCAWHRDLKLKVPDGYCG